MTVEEAMLETCSTGSVEGLSREMIAEAQRVDPSLLVALTHPRIKAKYDWVYLLLQPYAAESLVRVVQRRKTAVLTVASCLRVLPGQYLLYQWYRRKRCNIKLAAPPGSSNHEKGNAVDVERPSDWKPHFLAEGWRHLGSKDPPHFDRVSGRDDVDNRLCAAFQRLSNRHAGTKLTVDGNFGPTTEAALQRAPAAGWKGDEMAEDLERINVEINGANQTEVVKAFINRGNTLLDASDYLKFCANPPPRYNPSNQTLSIETQKTTCQVLVDDQPCGKPSVGLVLFSVLDGAGELSQAACAAHRDAAA